MEKRALGRSGVKASVIGLGTFGMGGGHWWGDFNEGLAIETIQRIPEVGMDMIDTAPIYGLGRSEELIGRALKKMNRNDVIISTKCGNWWHDVRGSRIPRLMYDVPMFKALDRSTIKTECEMSLKRLGVDYIDLYYTHSQVIPPVMTTIEETMDAMMELKKEGKILAIGTGNVTIDHLKEYTKWGQVDMIQNQYSMLHRQIEKDVVPFCIEHNIGIQTYSVLEKGLLSGRYKRDNVVPVGDIREESKWFRPENIGTILDMIDGWKNLCEKYNCALADLAIAWTKQQPGITNVLCGARRPEYMIENARGGEIVISDEDIARMNRDLKVTEE